MFVKQLYNHLLARHSPEVALLLCIFLPILTKHRSTRIYGLNILNGEKRYEACFNDTEMLRLYGLSDRNVSRHHTLHLLGSCHE